MSDYPRFVVLAAMAAVMVLGQADRARAELVLAKVFGDHMVIQRDKPVSIWGTADAGAAVTVVYAGRKAKAEADADGHWRATLKPMKASAKGRPLNVSAGDETVTLKDVLVGEVWLMVGAAGGTVDIPPEALPEHLHGVKVQKNKGLHKKHIAEADLPRVRLSDGDGRWTVIQPDNAGEQAADPFYFARELHRHLRAPVGIVHVPGSAPTFGWVPREAMEANEKTRKTILDQYDAYAEAYPELVKARKAMKKQVRDRQMPKEWLDPTAEDYQGAPGRAFEAHLEPYTPLTIRGATYQSRSGDIWGLPVSRTLYDTLPLLVKGWRDALGEADLPVLLVGNTSEQPAIYSRPMLPAPSNVAQDAQRRTAERLERVGLVVQSDFFADVEEAHKNQKFGERATRAARAVAYGEDIVPTGPMFSAARFEDGKAYIGFNHIDGGLIVGGSLLSEGGRLKGFTIAGEDRVWYWADAEIEGETVVVSSEDVAEPVAVRYAFAEGATPHLASEVGIPAPTFRTDDWSLDIPTREPRTTKVSSVDQPPKLDGEIGEGEWPGEPLTHFIVRDTYRPASHATRVWLAYDQDNLYLAAEAETPNSFPIAGMKTDDNRMIVYDDAVELLIDVNHDQTTYHRFAVNARGKVLDGMGYNAAARGIDFYEQGHLQNLRWFDETWDAEATVRTGFGDNQWSFEMAIPWSAMVGQGPPESGAKMGLQLIRTAATSQHVTRPFSWESSALQQRFRALLKNEWSQWTNTGRGTQTGATLAFDRHIHRPTRFGTMTLK